MEVPLKKLYYSISEVSKLTGLEQYVLRYWETEFSSLKPQKNRAGNRAYRQVDIDEILKIKELLYDRKFTIEGARQQLKRRGESPESGAVEAQRMAKYETIFAAVKKELGEILKLLSP